MAQFWWEVVDIPRRIWTILALFSCLVILVVTTHDLISSLPVYKELGIPVNPIQAIAWREVGLALFFIGILIGQKALKYLGSALIAVFTTLSLLTLLGNSVSIVPRLYKAAQWQALLSLVNSTLFRIALISVFIFLLFKSISDIPKLVMTILCGTTALSLFFLLYSSAGVLQSISFSEDYAGILLTGASLMILIWFMLFYFSWKAPPHQFPADKSS